MSGLWLWAKADRNLRKWFIAEACDADQCATEPRRTGGGLVTWPQARERLTIAQALEVLK